MMTYSYGKRLLGREPDNQGFSLIELMVALAVFLVVSGVSFTLFSRHQAMLSTEQETVGLNIGLRNALSQIQLDVANAGDGLLLGTNVPAWPVGVTIQNSNPTTAQCNPTATFPPTYAAACFDQFSVILADSNTPDLHPCVSTGCTISTSGSTTLTGQFSPGYASATYATNFHAGDQVLFVQACSGGGHASGSSGCMFTTAILTAAGANNTTATGCSAGCVTLNFNSTLAGGKNNASNDPLGMTTVAPSTDVTDQYGQNDWVVRLAPITYSVSVTHTDSKNEPDPQLIRTQSGTSNVVMDQIIGFKVGAALWNNSNTSTFQYNYNDATYSTPYEYNLIRSVRVSIIGRTEPDPLSTFRNTFDSGPYQIRGNSIIVDPRNLTMNND